MVKSNLPLEQQNSIQALSILLAELNSSMLDTKAIFTSVVQMYLAFTALLHCPDASHGPDLGSLLNRGQFILSLSLGYPLKQPI